MVSGAPKVGNSTSIKHGFGLVLGWLMLLFRAAITRETYSVCYVVVTLDIKTCTRVNRR